MEVQDRLDPLTLCSFLLVAPKYQGRKEARHGHLELKEHLRALPGIELANV